MRADGRSLNARGYPEGAVVKAANSTPVVPARSSPSRREDEVGAERLWWSDYCEQKLQELQGAFGKEIQQVTQRLQADLRFTEDRLAELVESEKASRSAQVMDLRREVEHQNAEMSEMVRSQVDLRDQMANVKGQVHRGDTTPLKSEVQELRSMLESREESKSTRSDDVTSESRSPGGKLPILEAALADLRREVQTCQEQSFNQSSEVEQLLNSLKRDVAEVQEKVSLHSKANDEQRSIQQVISQSTGDLGRGIEGLSTGLLNLETALRQELQKVDQQLRAELEELQHVQTQMSKNLKDERDARGRETSIVRSLLETSSDRLGQLESDLSAQDKHKVIASLEETTNELQVAMAQLQFDCRNKSDRVPHERAARSTAEMAEAAPVDGGFYLRLDALEAKLEAQVPKTLNLESQIKALNNEVNRRFHDLESQTRKASFETASLSARLESVEADTIKLTRESNDSQSLRSDIEALKRRIVAGAGTERPSLLGPESSSARRRALLPPDLRENISNLVHKVGDTTSPVFPGDEVTSDTASFHSGAKSGSDLPEQLQQQLRDGTVSQEGYRQALVVMQQLKERNDSLREKNQELAEEMFVPDGRSTMLPTWTAEQASHGSAMVPVAQYRQATRTSSPTRDRAKAPGPPGGPPGMTGGTLPQGVPMAPMAAPGMPNVSGVPVMPMAPVMIQRVKSSAPIQRSSSPDRRYF